MKRNWKATIGLTALLCSQLQAGQDLNTHYLRVSRIGFTDDGRIKIRGRNAIQELYPNVVPRWTRRGFYMDTLTEVMICDKDRVACVPADYQQIGLDDLLVADGVERDLIKVLILR